MTRQELDILYKRMPTLANGLFASQNNIVTANIPDNNDGNVFNYEVGFPEIYSRKYTIADPEISGKRVLLGDINLIGNLGSRGLYIRQHGGIYQFDIRVCDKIGGYPEGAILDYWDVDSNELRKVICIKDGGNCYTPPDDVEHGINGTSGDRHWEICDTLHIIMRDSNDNISGGANLTLNPILINSEWDSYKDRIIDSNGKALIPFAVVLGNNVKVGNFYLPSKDVVVVSLGSDVELNVSGDNILYLKVNEYVYTSTSVRGNVYAYIFKDENGIIL